MGNSLEIRAIKSSKEMMDFIKYLREEIPQQTVALSDLAGHLAATIKT